ncbi:hypothetical protein DAEQUDRAFT_808069 [Daedalea quercina L-15889]|uniref:Telomere-associated protein Rif1 N-terminal domain-containing protein n=1 Tax=Daedalea quercina L-15889 TaxID=1314783 RepID=A0A165TSZ4_9APHY|nr:hypothetical protein DAEQUDRAFT_808069 [Daedalea quercina L-15889]
MSPGLQAPSYGPNPSAETRFLRSPILTLLESLEDVEHDHISIHDLTDAYSTLCARFKAISDVLSRDSANVPALRFIEEHSVPIVECLRRDVRRALVDPVMAAPQGAAALIDIARPLDWSTNLDADEDMKIAKDTAHLCQTVLRTLSYIFRLPTLSVVFTADDLVQLADDVLDILQSASLPIPNEQKIQAMSVWMLSQGHFPAASVASRRTKIARILYETIEYGGIESAISDSLRALGTLLQAHPSIFLQPCTFMFPSVLNHLKSDAEHIRTEAVYVLNSFAFAMLSHEPDMRKDLVGPLRRPLQSFISVATGKHVKPAHDTNNFVASFMRSLEHKDTSLTQGIVQAQLVLAGVIAILGPEVFTHKASIKFVLKASAPLARHKLQPVRILHTLVWKCFVWALSEMKRGGDGAPSEPSASKTWSGALEVVKQERRNGVGAALISLLLGAPDTHHPHDEPANAKSQKVGEAVAVLRGMTEDRDSVRSEARTILSRLTSAIGSAPTPPSTPASDGRSFGNGLLVKELFDGTILRMDTNRLPAALTELSQFSTEKIRPLTEAEIVGSWDGLVETWLVLVKKDVLNSQGMNILPHDLLGSWQALLLVLAQLTQEHRHLTASPECALRVAHICRDVLEWQDDPAHKRLDETTLQMNQLRFVFMMWKVARNVFNASWLATAAEAILRAVLHRTYDLTIRASADTWAELCGTLVLAGSPNLLPRMAVGSEARQESEIKRHLWSVLAKSWTSSDVKPDWQVTISLVTLPIGLFSLCEDDISLWEELLGIGVASANSAHVPPAQVLETIAARFDEQSERLIKHPRWIVSLLPHITMHDDRMIPNNFLKLINDFLCDMYAAKQEHLYPALETFRILSSLLQSCSQHATVSLTSAMSDGLCIWIRDEEEILLEKEYNEVIMHLYQTTLARLTDYDFDADMLTSIAPFLASAFNRMPSPALGPVAFKDFWDAVRPKLTLRSSTLPETFKQALRVSHDFFGGNLPSDMSQDSDSLSQWRSQSQSQEESIVPETPSSQLLYEPLRLPEPIMVDPVSGGSVPARQEVVFSSNRHSPVSIHPGSLTPTCSMYIGHARTEDVACDDTRTPPRATNVTMSPEVPSPEGVYGGRRDDLLNRDSPTLSGNRTVREMPRASSVLPSPEVPFLHKDPSPGPSPSYPLSRRANSLPSSSLQDPPPPLSMSGSPPGRKRMQPSDPPEQLSTSHVARPRKKRRVSPGENNDAPGDMKRVAEHSPSHDRRPAATHSTSGVARSRGSYGAQRRMKWVFDGVVVPRLKDSEHWDTLSDVVLPSPLSSPPPSSAEQIKLRTPARMVSPLAENDYDYDTWEAYTVDPAEARRLQRELDLSSDHEQLVEDQLASSQVVDDSLLVPSSQDDETSNPTPGGSTRAPIMHASSSVPVASEHRMPLHRSCTTSDRLELLRRARERMREDGSQMPFDAISEAEDMLDDMYDVLKRLRRKFSGESKLGTTASEGL